jgi:Uma2 family endonuclease
MTLAQTHDRMTIDAYVAWAAAQASGRYELVDGEIVATPAEGGRHNLAKFRIARDLEDAVAAAGLECTVFTDGMTVRINNTHGREPDAAVTLTRVADLEAQILVDPVIVVEVVSPTSELHDTEVKLLEYFTVPSIQHYLIVLSGAKAIIHHARGIDGDIRTRIVRSGEILLDPPGLRLPVDAILAIG